VPEIPDREFPGHVTRIANALQPGSRTLLTEIDVPNPDYVLSPSAAIFAQRVPRRCLGCAQKPPNSPLSAGWRTSALGQSFFYWSKNCACISGG
jgi:hypothetical protein